MLRLSLYNFVIMLSMAMALETMAQDVRVRIASLERAENMVGGRHFSVRMRIVLDAIGGEYTSEEPACHGEYRFVHGLIDHIVVQNVSDPDDHGTALDQLSVWDENQDNDNWFGTTSYEEQFHGCVRDTMPDCRCDSAYWTWAWHCEASVLFTLPACGEFRVHYLADPLSWYLFCGSQPESLAVPVQRGFFCAAAIPGHCAGVDSNLVAYINNNVTVKDFADIAMDPCPEPPPGPGTIKFDGYVWPNGTNGADEWLPSPWDSIGLAFRVRAESTETYQITYDIWDITRWLGECMNSPRYVDLDGDRVADTGYWPTGFEDTLSWDSLGKFKGLDFTVGRPQEYNFFVHDKVTYHGRIPGNRWMVPNDSIRSWWPDRQDTDFPGRPLFETHIYATTRTSRERDTLWLRCHDYGAHCIVTPYVPGKDGQLMDFKDPYTLRPLRSVTVPFDYDGYSMTNYNYGDGMSDYWEDTTAHWPQKPHINTIRDIRPFVTTRYQEMADRDSVPRGRGFDGDRFCNFEEYRGLITKEWNGSSWKKYHRRLDRNHKSVIVHYRTNLDDSTRLQMPGWIGSLDTAQVYFADSIRFFRHVVGVNDNTLIDRVRNGIWGRDVNFNKAGAGLWYYGFAYPLVDPMHGPDTVRAVTFWDWNPNGDWQHDWPRSIGEVRTYGLTIGGRVFGTPGEGACVPNTVLRCLVIIDKFNWVRDRYYLNGACATNWGLHYPLEMGHTIAHEFGHGVGMEHIPEVPVRTIMNGIIRPNPCFVPPVNSYSAISRSHFSVKEPHP